MITDSLNLTGSRTIHTFKGRASNVYIIVDSRREKSFLIDCGMPSDAKSLVEVLQRMPPLRRIVCTHFHVDHVSGWIHLRTIFADCSIWFHENGKPWVTGLRRMPMPSLGDFKKVLIPCMREARYLPSLSDLIKGRLYGTPLIKGFPLDRVKFFANERKVLPGFVNVPTPGHRPESVSFFDQASGILVTGDFIIVINDEIAKNTFLASPDEQQASINRINRMSGLKFIFPGHGASRSFSKRELKNLI